MSTSRKRNEIRCARAPLLATYGTYKGGKPYIHIKVYKQRRICGEVFISADAEVKIRCRECLRLQRARIVSNRPMMQEEYENMEAAGPTVGSPDVAPDTYDGIR
jgi:hypothetical protein